MSESNAPKGKRPADSEIIMTELAIPNDANVLGNVLGGRVMHWIDLAAATAAHRHCRAICVTAAIEGLSFLNPIKVGHLAHLKARVVCVGKTSLVVKVDVHSENMDTGEMKKTSEAYLTFVCLDKNGVPRAVPPLILETEEEEAECEKAKNIRKRMLEIKRQES
ncbi:MAG: acyl-CoA thioesterase [Candidatus Zixiibacteriota bacterium]|nr:MAG: acyl-CoA thioesterase [candidate division Zixibacteria bacterium]